jgi:UDP:flavonoid glycosyltransferase YjiC (YdhE family)
MRVALVPFGTRGDIQPFLALGTALRARGHDVNLVTSPSFQSVADEAGLELTAIPADTGGFFQIPEVIEALRKSPSMLRMVRKLPKPPPGAQAALLGHIDAACGDADITINTYFTKGISVARPDRLWCATSWWPAAPTGAFPALGAPEWPLGPAYNRLTYAATAAVEWWSTRKTVNGFRARKGLPPLGIGSPYRSVGREVPVLYPYSTSLIPHPPDWPPHCHVTGYWYWQRTWQPPEGLAEFMDTERRPLVAAFGGTWAVHRQEHTREALREAARRTGRRIVVVGGDPEPLSPDAFHLTEADYDWLFSRASAVIHNAGYGSTAEVLRAGVPQVVVPTFADQPFWAARVHRAGVAARPVPFATMRVDELAAAAVSAVGDAAMAERARLLGARVRAEDGLSRTCDILEDWYERRAAPGSRLADAPRKWNQG